MSRTRSSIAASAFCGLLSLAGVAGAAEGPVDSTPATADSATTPPESAASSRTFDGLSAALLVGNGFEDGVNVGFGARLGTNLDRLYLGGTGVYHLGESRSASALGQNVDASLNIYYFGAEAGYDFSAGPILLRPYGGFGLGTARGCVNGSCDTESRAYIAPGVSVLAFVSDAFFVGGDARFVVPLDDDGSNFDHFGLFAFAGMSL